jgi:hypothetical protein
MRHVDQFATRLSGVKMFLLLVLVLVYLFYRWSVGNNDYFEKIGLPFDKPVPLFGNSLKFVMQKESLVYFMQRNYHKFKKSK